MINYEETESELTDDEINTLKGLNESYCYTNSLFDFHECHDEYNNENTVFSYTEMYMYM